jgi:hypothetical protein
VVAKDHPGVGADKVAPVLVLFTRGGPQVIEGERPGFDPFGVKPVPDEVSANGRGKKVNGVEGFRAAQGDRGVSSGADEDSGRTRGGNGELFS